MAEAVTPAAAGAARRRSPSLAHRGQYLLYRMAELVAWWLPEGLALALGSALGWTAGSLLRLRRGVVEENLARAFPHRDRAWRRRTAARVYRHLGRQGVILFRMARMGSEAVRERTEISGIEHVQEPLARGRGVVVATGHLGNWELGGASLTVRGIPLDVVARRQSNPLFDAHLRRTRETLGMRVVYRDEAPREVIRSLRGGGAVAMVADQHVARGGILVDFFGVPAATARGPALLALRTGAQVVMATATSLPGAPGRFQVTIRPLAVPDPEMSRETGNSEAEARVLTRAYLEALEDRIREAPDQYFWLHRRWKASLTQDDPETEARNRTASGAVSKDIPKRTGDTS